MRANGLPWVARIVPSGALDYPRGVGSSRPSFARGALRARPIAALLALLALPLFPMSAAPSAGEPSSPTDDPAAPVVEVWELVREHFMDAEFNGVDWDEAGRAARQQAKTATSQAEMAGIINAMLARLETSHTQYYTPDAPEYYQLLDVFAGPMGEWIEANVASDGVISYPGIGLSTRLENGRHFVKGLIPGTPAARSRIVVGDVVVAVDGEPFEPLVSFRGKVDKSVRVTIQRTDSTDSTQVINVTPVEIRPNEAFRTAIRTSARVVEQGERRIAYVRMWSYAGRAYQEELEAQLQSSALRSADALVLDVRDGWGGASPQYLNLFNTNTPVMRFRSRDGEWHTYDTQWRKPVVLLVNEGTRSGKEMLAYGFRKFGIGPVVGSRTAGAVTAGRLHTLKNGCLLYLAGSDVLVDDDRLEGRGVAPDVEVPFDYRFSAGLDPQLEKALEVAASEAAARESTGG
jgi:carboxyl-terminal processing protease